MTREDLIQICEDGIVPQEKWMDRDSAEAQKQLGEALALLKCGCDFVILKEGDLKTDSRTIWIEIYSEGFAHHDYGGNIDRDTYYLPTRSRLDNNKNSDWY